MRNDTLTTGAKRVIMLKSRLFAFQQNICQRGEHTVTNNFIMRELYQLNNAMRKFFDRSPVKKELDSVSGTHGWVIAYLATHENEDVYQRDLEREFGITRSTTSKMIALMEKNGLVGKEKVACDDRLKKLVLTERSKKLAEKICKDNQKTEKQLTKGFSNEELKMLSEFMRRMKENLQGERKD